MKRLLLSALVLILPTSARIVADDPPPKNGPVRIQGEITDKDARVKFQLDAKSARDMRAKPYDVQLVAGKTYTITLDAVGKGKGLDPFLVVQDPDGKTIAFDDDSGGNLNARLTLRVPKDATYRIYAAALGGTGGFALNIIEANVVRQGFPAAKADPADLAKSDTAWEIEWDISNADDGLRWMNGFEKARRGEKMLLWSLFHGGNYRYIIEYGFSDDGVISCRLGATAHNFFDKQTDGRDVHLHVGCWCWNPELSEEGE